MMLNITQKRCYHDIQIKNLERVFILDFKLNGIILNVVDTYKYLGYYVTDDLMMRISTEN